MTPQVHAARPENPRWDPVLEVLGHSASLARVRPEEAFLRIPE
jgi:hypothetical protein